MTAEKREKRLIVDGEPVIRDFSGKTLEIWPNAPFWPIPACAPKEKTSFWAFGRRFQYAAVPRSGSLVLYHNPRNSWSGFASEAKFALVSQNKNHALTASQDGTQHDRYARSIGMFGVLASTACFHSLPIHRNVIEHSAIMLPAMHSNRVMSCCQSKSGVCLSLKHSLKRRSVGRVVLPRELKIQC